ncbi:unnamed protein product [Rotaria sordida]|uniref:Uncharacterized protein n=1 Tax=Rotaria sordida TaxID=392033 RepID=A0A815B0Z1_9BILA|nr:unnamed protein product [Rotaria sordida]CAF3811459.1 unnamed protein product [Rotaria sordida]
MDVTKQPIAVIVHWTFEQKYSDKVSSSTIDLNNTSFNLGDRVLHVNFTNPCTHLACNGGLYMADADGNKEQLLFSFPIEDDFTGPYGVTIGVDPFGGKRYIYWC